MSKGKNADRKPSPEDAVLSAVEANPGAATEDIAKAAGLARSTASKALARLADSGKVVRHEGDREQGRRLPDRWTFSGVEIPAAYAAHVKSAPGSGGARAGASTTKPAGKAGAKPAKSTGVKPTGGKRAAAKGARAASEREQPAGKPDRLKAHGLDPLVLAYVDGHTASAPHGPVAVAKAINRSSGAVANCMKRLAESKQLRQVGDKPVRYEKIAASSGARQRRPKASPRPGAGAR